MNKMYYCYVVDCYVGDLLFEGDSISFVWRNEDNYTTAAENFRNSVYLDTEEEILLFIKSRVMDRDTIDGELFLSMYGLSPTASDIEIFIGNNGMSYNDRFWISDSKTPNKWRFIYSENNFKSSVNFKGAKLEY